MKGFKYLWARGGGHVQAIYHFIIVSWFTKPVRNYTTAIFSQPIYFCIFSSRQSENVDMNLKFKKFKI